MPDVATLNGVWEDDAFELKGAARAMYRGGEFTSVSGSTATIEFPNEAHRARCEAKRSQAEQALTARFGTPITLVLTVAGGAAAPASAAPEPEPEPEVFEDLGVTDVRELDDAPSASAGGLDALTEAFPGAEFVE